MTHPLHENNLRKFSTERLLGELQRRGVTASAPSATRFPIVACKVCGGTSPSQCALYAGHACAHGTPSPAAFSPEGWKLVPVEATAAMVNALHHGTWEGEPDPKPGGVEYALWLQAYRVMLAAAPEYTAPPTRENT